MGPEKSLGWKQGPESGQRTCKQLARPQEGRSGPRGAPQSEKSPEEHHTSRQAPLGEPVTGLLSTPQPAARTPQPAPGWHAADAQETRPSG